MAYLRLSFYFILFSNFQAIAQPDIDRFGFEIELDKEQLEKLVDYFDFNKIEPSKLNGKTLKHYTGNLDVNDFLQFKGYLADPSIFKTLSKSIQNEIIEGVAKTTFTKNIIKRLQGVLPPIDTVTDKNQLREIKIGWKQFGKYWDTEISKEKKRNSIKMNKLPKK
jgi:hypothetical protein